MTCHRALTSTFRSVIALFTAVLIAVVGATALPTAAFAGGNGKAKGHQSDQSRNGADRSHQAGRANASGKTNKSDKSASGTSRGGASQSGASQGGGKDRPAKAPKSPPAQDSAPASSAGDNNGKSDQAKGNKGGNDAAGGGSAGGSSDKGDPAGNNGTIKLAGFGDGNGPGHSSGDGSTPMHPSNDPHLPCGFSVEWFGFDSGVTSEVTFEQHAPTRGGSAHHDSVQLDDDSHAGGGSTAGYDGVETYNIDWDGEPHSKHGYHIKLTTNTPYSQGSDVKHKVFWVEPCDVPTETPDEETPDEETPDEETPDEETPDEETPGEETPGEETPDEETPGDEDGNTDLFFTEDSTTPQVLGVQASAGNSQSGSQAAPAEAPAEVPTAVNSGLTGDDWSRSVLPLLAVLLGLATTFVALARRRAPVEADSLD